MHPHTPKGRYRFFIKLWWSHVKHDGRGLCLFMYFMHRDDECKWGVQQQISCTISWYSQKLTGSNSCFDVLCVFLLSADLRQAEVKLCFQILHFQYFHPVYNTRWACCTMPVRSMLFVRSAWVKWLFSYACFPADYFISIHYEFISIPAKWKWYFSWKWFSKPFQLCHTQGLRLI